MKDELQKDTIFYKARSLSKRIQDISYALSQLEFKHPLSSLTSEMKEWMIKTYLAYKFEIADLLKDFERLSEEYEKELRKNK